ncbi:cyclopropane-fatty-acyl-phospholipid synthase [Gemmobacter lanyuensis]|uniref:Cyclopropane-fatty-acyl-phospholipid synthase n=1 Tax=Gemmobacter lanyuensis TaxID=1054497 RepID=A0A918IR03_9RHOB|nr:FAD-dependent oxidoreductase [Gemmobacter lanyuensis]GGW26381.1 cyclopropane-fatty-acyl-phospholipid synthase [Gemmobacter lanyuensis]
MPFEMPPAPRRRVAVIGGGISGMAAAHFLADQAEVTLFEAAQRLGGHARTVVAGKRGDQPVDTGFIVFNNENYPHLTRLFDDLRVPTKPSNMSFGASFGGGRMEYALASLDTLFAQRWRGMDPRFLRMLRDILHFNANAERALKYPGMTIREFLRELGTGAWFRDRYLLPFSGAIWSTPAADILDFPAHALITFFRNHKLMNTSGHHQWYTVDGGSVEYVRRLQAGLEARGVQLRLGAGVAGVRRSEGPQVRAYGGDWESFDEVVFALHSDDALRCLADPTPEERAALEAVGYQPNEAILHCDPSAMPKRRKCWSSWVYVESQLPMTDRVSLTYWMNSLQGIPEEDPLFVTLNPAAPLREELIYDSVTFRHPVFDLEALAAQRAIRAMNGTRDTWFCGAWMRNGFHEDGIASAVEVVEAMASRNRQQAAA